MSRTSRFTFLALLLAALTGLFLLWPAPALAQEPEAVDFDFSLDPYNSEFTTLTWAEFLAEWPPAFGGCDPIDPWTANPSDLGVWREGLRWSTIACGIQQYDSTPSFGPHFIIGLKTNFTIYSPDTTADFYITYHTPTANGELSNSVYCSDDGAYEAITKIGQSGNEAHYEIEAGQSCQIVVAYRFVDFAEDPYSGVTRFRSDYAWPSGAVQCSLVQNANFEAEDGWLLSGTAVITDGTLILGPGDIAAQNLTLTANRTYNAVISATAVTTSTPLKVVLGTQNETLTIEEPGLYTATFTTPSNLAGPIVYGLENNGSGTLTLDFTCVSLQSTGQSGQACLAPANGTFENDSGWNWYRGAEWFYPGKYASLPLADLGLIGSSSTYTMPTLAVGEHLLLGFTARGLGDDGVISGQVTNGVSTAEFNLSTYRAEYSYEISLDTLAEETGVQFSFVNPGDVITDVVSSADVVVDNICVFLANRGPNLPTPTDPDGITPLDPGLQGFTTCADVDGIWAGFGVNMAQYRADYAAGTSVWDPFGWVPWLISAIFVTLASWACFFFAAFLNLIDLIVYFLNSVMNIGNWLVRMWPLFVAWLSGWNDWLAGSLASIANAIGNALAAWSNWIGDALWATSTTIGLTLAAASEWLGNNLASLSDSIAAFLSGWSNWIAESLANLSDWIGATLATLWDWLASYFLSLNGLRIVINWLITAWNAFLAALGLVISGILETLIGIWNGSLWPFLSEVWAFISGMPATIASLLVDFVGAAWELLKTMFLWLWENVVSVAHTPLTFYYAFDSGINADPYGLVSCAGENFWCTFLSGVQLINQLIAHSTLYPIVIVGIILSTLWILWDNFRELFFSPIEIR